MQSDKNEPSVGSSAIEPDQTVLPQTDISLSLYVKVEGPLHVSVLIGKMYRYLHHSGLILHEYSAKLQVCSL